MIKALIKKDNNINGDAEKQTDERIVRSEETM